MKFRRALVESLREVMHAFNPSNAKKIVSHVKKYASEELPALGMVLFIFVPAISSIILAIWYGVKTWAYGSQMNYVITIASVGFLVFWVWYSLKVMEKWVEK